jgi:hypothetical protein
VLSPQEYREQARAAVSDSERKLYRQLAVFSLENAVRLEPRAIELRDADSVALPVISPTVAPTRLPHIFAVDLSPPCSDLII